MSDGASLSASPKSLSRPPKTFFQHYDNCAQSMVGSGFASHPYVDIDKKSIVMDHPYVDTDKKWWRRSSGSPAKNRMRA